MVVYLNLVLLSIAMVDPAIAGVCDFDFCAELIFVDLDLLSTQKNQDYHHTMHSYSQYGIFYYPPAQQLQQHSIITHLFFFHYQVRPNQITREIKLGRKMWDHKYRILVTPTPC